MRDGGGGCGPLKLADLVKSTLALTFRGVPGSLVLPAPATSSQSKVNKNRCTRDKSWRRTLAKIEIVKVSCLLGRATVAVAAKQNGARVKRDSLPSPRWRARARVIYIKDEMKNKPKTFYKKTIYRHFCVIILPRNTSGIKVSFIQRFYDTDNNNASWETRGRSHRKVYTVRCSS